ncbi:MAG: hypothetical protein HQK59_03700 [Deltaproteobacteria bacterium]|nr:hypothetical protein [Deltaproteobacteria bacterium]MBF0526421.1 hypothetical protein [Deltaproteobacteria bacterium]
MKLKPTAAVQSLQADFRPVFTVTGRTARTASADYSNLVNTYLVKVTPGTEAASCASFNKSPNVTYAEPNYLNYTCVTPNIIAGEKVSHFGR